MPSALPALLIAHGPVLWPYRTSSLPSPQWPWHLSILYPWMLRYLDSSTWTDLQIGCLWPQLPNSVSDQGQIFSESLPGCWGSVRFCLLYICFDTSTLGPVTWDVVACVYEYYSQVVNCYLLNCNLSPHLLACVYSCDLHSCLWPLVGHEGRWWNGCTGIKLLISRWMSQKYCCWQTCHCGHPPPPLSHTHTHTHTHIHTQWTATLLITLVSDYRGKECLRDTENSFHISENILYHIQSLRQPHTYTRLNGENSVEGYES